MVTATDMSVLCGNNSETCYTKYGSYSLHRPYCHEQGLRILLACIQTHAARHKRYIVPVLSLSIDFYVRVFMRVYTSPLNVRFPLFCIQVSKPVSMDYRTRWYFISNLFLGSNCPINVSFKFDFSILMYLLRPTPFCVHTVCLLYTVLTAKHSNKDFLISVVKLDAGYQTYEVLVCSMLVTLQMKHQISYCNSTSPQSLDQV